MNFALHLKMYLYGIQTFAKKLTWNLIQPSFFPQPMAVLDSQVVFKVGSTDYQILESYTCSAKYYRICLNTFISCKSWAKSELSFPLNISYSADCQSCRKMLKNNKIVKSLLFNTAHFSSISSLI